VMTPARGRRAVAGPGVRTMPCDERCAGATTPRRRTGHGFYVRSPDGRRNGEFDKSMRRTSSSGWAGWSVSPHGAVATPRSPSSGSRGGGGGHRRGWCGDGASRPAARRGGGDRRGREGRR
jgi:hypothetical protein